jgi:hypothetical protein
MHVPRAQDGSRHEIAIQTVIIVQINHPIRGRIETVGFRLMSGIMVFIPFHGLEPGPETGFNDNIHMIIDEATDDGIGMVG